MISSGGECVCNWGAPSCSHCVFGLGHQGRPSSFGTEWMYILAYRSLRSAHREKTAPKFEYYTRLWTKLCKLNHVLSCSPHAIPMLSPVSPHVPPMRSPCSPHAHVQAIHCPPMLSQWGVGMSGKCIALPSNVLCATYLVARFL